MGQPQLLHGQQAADPEAAGQRQVEAGVDGACGRVQRGQAALSRPVDGLELTADVDRAVAHGQGGRLRVRGRGERGYRCPGGRVEAGDLALGHAVDGVELPSDVQGGAVRGCLDRVHHGVEGRPEVHVDLAGVEVVGREVLLGDGRAADILDRGEGPRDEHPGADHLHVPDLPVGDDRGVGARNLRHQGALPGHRLGRDGPSGRHGRRDQRRAEKSGQRDQNHDAPFPGSVPTVPPVPADSPDHLPSPARSHRCRVRVHRRTKPPPKRTTPGSALALRRTLGVSNGGWQCSRPGPDRSATRGVQTGEPESRTTATNRPVLNTMGDDGRCEPGPRSGGKVRDCVT